MGFYEFGLWIRKKVYNRHKRANTAYNLITLLHYKLLKLLKGS